MKRVIHSTALLGFMLLSGCSTPKAVLQLSDKTAGNVTLLNNYLDSFTKSQFNLTSQRIAISADQASTFAALSARCRARMDAMRLAGMTDQLDLINNLDATSDSEAAIQNKLLLVSSNETAVLEASQAQLKSYGKQLGSLSSTLSQLAIDDSLETRVQNLIASAQVVQTDMQNAKSSSTNASEDMAEKASMLNSKSIASAKSLLGKINN
jgi:hypothetical protein